MTRAGMTDWCDGDKLFDLGFGRLPEGEAEELRAHVASCASCRETLRHIELLHDTVAPLRTIGLPQAVSDRVLAALDGEMSRAASRMRSRQAWRTLFSVRTMAAFASAALVLVVTAVGITLHLSTPEVPSLPGPVRLVQGQVVTTAAAEPVQASMDCGALVSLEEESEAKVVESLEDKGLVELKKGVVHVAVKKLPKSGRFEVITADAAVAVKGTMFSVKKTSENATVVSVTEGKVLVTPRCEGREEIFLIAGESTTVPSVPAYLASLQEQGVAAMAEARYDDAQAHFESYLQCAGDDDDSDVALLLADVLQKRGDVTSASKMYRKLAEGGTSLRAENALAYLAMLQAASGQHAAAGATWSEYLSRFPGGLFADEAVQALQAYDTSNDPATQGSHGEGQ